MISTDEVASMARAEVAAAARQCATLAGTAEAPAEHLGGWSSKAATEYAACVRNLKRVLTDLQDDLRILITAVEQGS